MAKNGAKRPPGQAVIVLAPRIRDSMARSKLGRNKKKEPRCAAARRVQLSRTTRECIAYHEAGHVVVGVLLRWAIREVSIVPIGNTLGYVRHPRSAVDYWSAEEIQSQRSRSEISVTAPVPGSSPSQAPSSAGLRRTRARIDIAVRLAGPLSERLFTGRWNIHCGAVDRFQVQDLASQLADDLATTPNRIIVCEGLRSSRLLRANWCRVQAVAGALLQHDRLTGREVRAIVKGAFPTVLVRATSRDASAVAPPARSPLQVGLESRV